MIFVHALLLYLLREPPPLFAISQILTLTKFLVSWSGDCEGFYSACINRIVFVPTALVIQRGYSKVVFNIFHATDEIQFFSVPCIILCGIVKVKFLPSTSWRNTKGSRGVVPFILNLGARWRWVINFKSRKEPRFPLNRRDGWVPYLVWTSVPGFEARTVKPVVMGWYC